MVADAGPTRNRSFVFNKQVFCPVYEDLSGRKIYQLNIRRKIREGERIIMKKTILAAVFAVLSSGPAYAESAFKQLGDGEPEISLPASEVVRVEGSAYPQSSRYDELTDNPDGSVSIKGPKFNYNGRQNIVYFSVNSGVCELFGYSAAVVAIRGKDLSGLKLPVIDNEGMLAGMSDNTDIYDTIVCRPSIPVVIPSRQYTALAHNGDGSVTIVRPRFDLNSVPTRISYLSVNSGVCKLFGYSAAVIAVRGTDSSVLKSAVINSEGKLWSINNAYDDVLDSIVCK